MVHTTEELDQAYFDGMEDLARKTIGVIEELDMGEDGDILIEFLESELGFDPDEIEYGAYTFDELEALVSSD